jgi:hypothetical protein
MHPRPPDVCIARHATHADDAAQCSTKTKMPAALAVRRMPGNAQVKLKRTAGFKVKEKTGTYIFLDNFGKTP